MTTKKNTIPEMKGIPEIEGRDFKLVASTDGINSNNYRHLYKEYAEDGSDESYLLTSNENAVALIESRKFIDFLREIAKHTIHYQYNEHVSNILTAMGRALYDIGANHFKDERRLGDVYVKNGQIIFDIKRPFEGLGDRVLWQELENKHLNILGVGNGFFACYARSLTETAFILKLKKIETSEKKND